MANVTVNICSPEGGIFKRTVALLAPMFANAVSAFWMLVARVLFVALQVMAAVVRVLPDPGAVPFGGPCCPGARRLCNETGLECYRGAGAKCGAPEKAAT